MSANSNRYRPSCMGIARYCWVNKPDTKYNEDGLYHTDIVAEGEDAQHDADFIKEAAEAAFVVEADKRKLSAAERKKWKLYLPYEEETDPDNGNPTGRIIFKYKQNAKLHLPDGETKVFKVGIRDSQDKAIDDAVFSGSTIRVMYKPRNVVIASTKQIGVRLDFCLVQLIKKAEGKGLGFDEVDGGYTRGDYEENDNSGGGGPSGAGGDGDY